VGSFVGAVDEQVKNRVSQIKIKDVVDLAKRDVFKKFGIEYYDSVKTYIFWKIKDSIEAYLKLNRVEAFKLADKSTSDFYGKYKLNVKVSASESALDLILEGLREIYEIKKTSSLNGDYEPTFPRKYVDIQDNIVLIFKGKYENDLMLKSASKTVDEILLKNTDASEYKKLRYKKSEVLEQLAKTDSPQVVKVNGKAVKGIIVSRELLFKGFEDDNTE
jgi:hypothetical protein